MARALSLSTVVVSLLLACVFSGTSRAALLAEIGINVAPAFDGSPPSSDVISYSFIAGSNFPTNVGDEWQRQITASDVALTFEAPPELVESIAPAIARKNAGISIRVHNIQYSKPLDQLQVEGWGLGDRATFHEFVPDITKVPVNRITMTIDSFHFERFGDNAGIGGGHTIRIYGVPEPMSFISVLFCVASLSCYRRSRH